MNQDQKEAQEAEEQKFGDKSSGSPIKKKRELYKLPKPNLDAYRSGLQDQSVNTS